MPKEVKAFGCIYSCGRRVQTSRKAMEKHEQTCALNPDRRACKACKHKRLATLPADQPGHVQTEPLCDIGQLPYGHLMRFDCPSWEAA